MKTIKILLGIIAINLTLLTIIQTGVWPPKVQASETNYSNVNYGLVPLNEDGSIDVKLSEETVEAIKPPAIMDVNVATFRGRKVGMSDHENDGLWNLSVNAYCYGYDGLEWTSMSRR